MWQAEQPRWRLFPLVVSWLAAAAAFMVAAGILPGVYVDGFLGALLVAAVVAVLNAVIPPVLAALRLPATLVLGFLLVLFADAGILLATDALTDGILRVDNFGWALLASLVVAAVSVVLAVLLGTDDTSSIRIAQRIARRQGIIAQAPTSRGSSSSRSTGSPCRCCSGRCATATRRRWPAGWPTARTA